MALEQRGMRPNRLKIPVFKVITKMEYQSFYLEVLWIRVFVGVSRANGRHKCDNTGFQERWRRFVSLLPCSLYPVRMC